MDEKNDYFFRVILLSDYCVGKTSLISRFVHDEFKINTSATIGVDFVNKNIQIEGKTVKAQIWDTGGHERYREISMACCRWIVGAVLIYDITQYSTFENVKGWLKELRDLTPNVVIMLVGNKSDLHHLRAVPAEEAKAYAKKNQLLFTETSAMDSTNVEIAFRNLFAEIYRSVVNKQVLQAETSNEPLEGPAMELVNSAKRCCIL